MAGVSIGGAPTGPTFEAETAAAQIPTSVPRGTTVGANDNGLTWNGSAWVSSKMALAEPFTSPYTLYVSSAASGGSDSNKGNSPGNAFATLTKAINFAQQTGQHPARIVICSYATTDLTLSAPVAIVQKLWIEALAPSSATIDRGFSTPNGRSVWDAVTVASSTTVNSATAAFVVGDVNRIVMIYGAGTGGGTYYGFITSRTDGSNVVVDNAPVLARNATTDPVGVKMSIVGDWNRVVTDASMTSGSGVITSATAAWTVADIGTEVVIAGAGQGGQALRGAIKSISGNTATLAGAVSSATITNKRCAIGVNFGDLLTYHAGQGGLRNILLQDTSSGNNSIGAAIKIMCDDGGAGSQVTPSDLYFENLRITSQDSTGAWEHIIDVDGSWNQNAGGPGVRRCCFIGPFFFGSRKPGETVRLVNPVHINFISCGSGGSAPLTSTEQGVVILDPQNNGGGRGGPATQDVNFTGFEGDAWCYYTEGWNCTFQGDRLNMSSPIPNRQVVRLGPTSQYCRIVCPNQSTVGGSITALMADEYDAGTNNYIDTQKFDAKRPTMKAYDNALPTAPALSFETFSRRQAMTTSQTAPGTSSGIMLMQSLWLPGGAQINRLGLMGHNTTPLAWGSPIGTSPHFIYGIYDPDGNLFGQSADTGGTQVFNGTLSNDVVNIAKDGAGNTVSSVRVPRTGLCFIGLLIVAGTGNTGFAYPTFTGYATPLAALAPAITGSNGSGLTALPTTAAATGIGFMIYGGVG